jgi:hypothetical protein
VLDAGMLDVLLIEDQPTSNGIVEIFCWFSATPTKVLGNARNTGTTG